SGAGSLSAGSGTRRRQRSRLASASRGRGYGSSRVGALSAGHGAAIPGGLGSWARLRGAAPAPTADSPRRRYAESPTNLPDLDDHGAVPSYRLAMLQATGLTKRYGDLVALNALDLTVAEGELFCLLGANGAGKTTTIQLFLGF